MQLTKQPKWAERESRAEERCTRCVSVRLALQELAEEARL